MIKSYLKDNSNLNIKIIECKKYLFNFMNKNEVNEIARTEVTKSLIAYIKENKLENAANRKIIMPDNKLKYLLGLEEGQELTFFNIQKYMNKHFVKNAEL